MAFRGSVAISAALLFLLANMGKIYYASRVVHTSNRWAHLASLTLLLLCVLVASFLRSKRKQTLVLSAISTLVSVVLFADVLHWRFFHELPTVYELRNMFMLTTFGA